MPNFVATNLYRSLNSSAAVSIALPTLSHGIVIEAAPANTVINGVTINAIVILPATGLNKKERRYYSATAFATLISALGAGYVTVSVFKSEQSAAATNVAFPANGSNMVIEAVSGLTLGTTPILSKFVIPATGLNQPVRTYFSGATVAANVTLMG